MSASPPTAFRHFSDVLLTLYRTAATTPHCNAHDALLAQLHQALAFDQAIWRSFKPNPKKHLPASQPPTPLTHTQFAPAVAEQQRSLPQKNCFRLSMHLPQTAPFKTSLKTPSTLQQSPDTDSEQDKTPADDADDDITHVLHLFREKDKTPFSPSDRDLLETISPHLRQALHIQQTQQLEHLMRQHPHQTAALLTDRQGLIHQASTGCRHLLRAEFSAHADKHSLPSKLLHQLKENPQPYRGQHLVATFTPCATQTLTGVLLRPACAIDQLPPRQRQVAELASQGLNHKQIAQRLDLAPATIRNQLQLIYKRLNIHGSAALTQLIMRAP